MKIMNKFILILLAFSLVPLLMFLLTFYTVSQQKYDGFVINLAGRQRMLSQRMSKECLTFIHYDLLGAA